MSSNTKIFVLRSRDLILTGVIFVLLLIAFLAILFLRSQSSSTATQTRNVNTSALVSDSLASSVISDEAASYIPGRYCSTFYLGENAVDIVVCVDKNRITSIRAQNLAHSVATLYPMVPSVLESLKSQILTSQSLQGITYSDSSRYTAEVLLDAISNALSPALLD